VRQRLAWFATDSSTIPELRWDMPSDLTSSTGSGSHLPVRERRSQFGYEIVPIVSERSPIPM
jgi:hypothetical protein